MFDKQDTFTYFFLMLCRSGGTGRHEGLKIPWANRPYGFESRLRHFYFFNTKARQPACAMHADRIAGLFFILADETRAGTSGLPVRLRTGRHKALPLHFICVPSAFICVHLRMIFMSCTALTTSSAVGIVASSRGLLNGTGTSIAPRRTMGASM